MAWSQRTVKFRTRNFCVDSRTAVKRECLTKFWPIRYTGELLPLSILSVFNLFSSDLGTSITWLNVFVKPRSVIPPTCMQFHSIGRSKLLLCKMWSGCGSIKACKSKESRLTESLFVLNSCFVSARYHHSDAGSNYSTTSAVEARIMELFQKDFLALLGTFQ